MATQRLVHVIPVSIRPPNRLKFVRALLYEGVSLFRSTGPLGWQVAERTKTFPVQPDFVPTHLIVIDENAYFQGLDSRLTAEHKTRDRRDYVDLDGIARQVLVATSLLGHCLWQLGGHHRFDFSGVSPFLAGYSHRDTVSISDLLRFYAPSNWYHDVHPGELRQTCKQLDCYYRSGTWWVDRLSVALGYFWSGLTTTHGELTFVSLCMALEAVASTSSSEITHILAERCALLVETTAAGRLETYEEIKNLYRLRSKIVHGRSSPQKGLINLESLAITAKKSLVPRSALFRILAVTIRVINGILSRKDLLALLHVQRSEDKASEALNAYFQRLLLCGEA